MRLSCRTCTGAILFLFFPLFLCHFVLIVNAQQLHQRFIVGQRQQASPGGARFRWTSSESASSSAATFTTNRRWTSGVEASNGKFLPNNDWKTGGIGQIRPPLIKAPLVVNDDEVAAALRRPLRAQLQAPTRNVTHLMKYFRNGFFTAGIEDSSTDGATERREEVRKMPPNRTQPPTAAALQVDNTSRGLRALFRSQQQQRPRHFPDVNAAFQQWLGSNGGNNNNGNNNGRRTADLQPLPGRRKYTSVADVLAEVRSQSQSKTVRTTAANQQNRQIKVQRGRNANGNNNNFARKNGFGDGNGNENAGRNGWNNGGSIGNKNDNRFGSNSGNKNGSSRGNRNGNGRHRVWERREEAEEEEQLPKVAEEETTTTSPPPIEPETEATAAPLDVEITPEEADESDGGVWRSGADEASTTEAPSPVAVDEPKLPEEVERFFTEE